MVQSFGSCSDEYPFISVANTRMSVDVTSYAFFCLPLLFCWLSCTWYLCSDPDEDKTDLLSVVWKNKRQEITWMSERSVAINLKVAYVYQCAVTLQDLRPACIQCTAKRRGWGVTYGDSAFVPGKQIVSSEQIDRTWR
jgi:hypothetical protein